MRYFEKYIKEEHRRAELLRLRQGLEGCGCTECQQFYQTIDLLKYDGRVSKIGDFIFISSGKPEIDLLQRDDDGSSTPDIGTVNISPTKPEAPMTEASFKDSPSQHNDDGDVSKIETQGFLLPDIYETKNIYLKRTRGRPRKTGQVSRTTGWRRKKERVQESLI